MNKILITICIYIAIFSIGIGGGVMFSGCKFAPVRDNYNNEECYAMADCMYRFGDKDISICRDLVTECGLAYQEQRIKKRHEYCKQDKNRAERQTYNECVLTLVPKKSG